MLLDDGVYGREPEPGPLADALGREEGFENVGLDLGTHADPGVAYAQHRVGPRARARMRAHEDGVELDVGGLDGQAPALRHRVACVHRQVQDDLLDLRGIGLHATQRGVEHRDQLDRLADQRPQHLRDVRHHAVEIQHPRLEHLLAAEGEELLGERRRAVRRLLDQLDIAPPRVVGR